MLADVSIFFNGMNVSFLIPVYCDVKNISHRKLFGLTRRKITSEPVVEDFSYGLLKTNNINLPNNKWPVKEPLNQFLHTAIAVISMQK
ncbi:MAG: hypothetical protein Fur0012_07540 [Elusimicrobiota bacterium]